MSLEDKLEANTAALKANTEALLAVLAASGNTAAAPAPDAAPAKTVKRKAAQAPEPEPTAATPGTKVEAPAPAPVAKPPGDDRQEHPEFNDPLDAPAPALDPQALIADITSSWKALQLAAVDTERKQFLTTKFGELRNKWGLKPEDKLAALTPTPEKLAGLLADIKAI